MGVPPMSSVTSPAILGFSNIIRAPPRTRRLAPALGRNACALPVSSASATASLSQRWQGGVVRSVRRRPVDLQARSPLDCGAAGWGGPGGIDRGTHLANAIMLLSKPWKGQ